MKVIELIEHLKGINGDFEVVIEDPEGNWMNAEVDIVWSVGNPSVMIYEQGKYKSDWDDEIR